VSEDLLASGAGPGDAAAFAAAVHSGRAQLLLLHLLLSVREGNLRHGVEGGCVAVSAAA
jgi:hypothetical protein